MLDEVEIECPYCGAAFTALIEPGDAGADYIQDCEICCRPLRFHVRAGSDAPVVEVAAEDD